MTEDSENVKDFRNDIAKIVTFIKEKNNIFFELSVRGVKMADYRTIRMAFWNAPFIRQMSPEGKLLYLYLATCPHTNTLGVLEITRRKMPAVLEANEKFVTNSNAVCLKNFIKNKTATGHKIFAWFAAQFKKTTSATIKDKIFAVYPKIFEGMDSASRGIHSHS